MKEQIQDQINRYKNELSDREKLLTQWKILRDKTPRENTEKLLYWKSNIDQTETEVKEIKRFLNSLNFLLNECPEKPKPISDSTQFKIFSRVWGNIETCDAEENALDNLMSLIDSETKIAISEEK